MHCVGGPLRWRHNDHAGVSNHQPHGCLLNRLFRRESKKTSKLRVTGLCAGNSPGTGEFPAQMASYAENVSIWWRHHAKSSYPRQARPARLALFTNFFLIWIENGAPGPQFGKSVNSCSNFREKSFTPNEQNKPYSRYCWLTCNVTSSSLLPVSIASSYYKSIFL